MLVKIMNDYRLRDIFKHDFEQLHLKFFQLERMIEVSHLSTFLQHTELVFGSLDLPVVYH